MPAPTRRLASHTRSFAVGGVKGYLTVGCTVDGEPVQVTVRMAKQGSTLAGIMDALSGTVTSGLRSGVPLRALVDEWIGTRFEPAGQTNDPQIRQATSVMDYVGRRLVLDHLGDDAEPGSPQLGTPQSGTAPGHPGHVATARVPAPASPWLN